MDIIKTRLNQNRRKRIVPAHRVFKFFAHTALLALLVCFAALSLSAEENATDEPTNAETQATENADQKNGDTQNEGKLGSKSDSTPPKTNKESDTDTSKSDERSSETPSTGENTKKKNDGTENTAKTDAKTDRPVTETSKEIITGTAKRMERYEKEGLTILFDEAKTVRQNEQGVEIGYLNADKITLKNDPQTGETIEIVAEGSVEIRDRDIFATCEHATMDNLKNTIVLKNNVVVLQNKDRLETKLFTFDRTTGKQMGEGGVKFKVSVTQALPVAAATAPEGKDEQSQGSTSAKEEKTDAADFRKTEDQAKKETDTEVPQESSSDGSTEADPQNSEEPDAEKESETETEAPDDNVDQE